MSCPEGAFGPVRFPVHPPSGWEDSKTQDVAADEPSLAYVHGFNATCRPPVLEVAPRSVAVAAGKLVVLSDIESGEQRCIFGHTARITCLAYSPEQRFGASGQARRPGSRFAEVLLWCPQTLQRFVTLSHHQVDVEAIGFAQGGEVLVTIGSDRDHTLALWCSAREGWFNYRRKGPLAVCSAYKSGFVGGVVAAPDVADAPAHFATFGASHLKFWSSDRVAPALVSRRGAFGNQGAPRAVVAVAWATRNRLMVAGDDGEIFFFEGTQAIRRFQPHRGKTAAVLVPLHETLLVTYSNQVCSVLQGERHIDHDLARLPGAPDARVQSAVLGGAVADEGAFVLVATRTHLLRLEVGVGPNEPFRACEILVSQANQELTDVCAHPVEPRVFTSSLDGYVRCYRSDNHRPLPERSFKASCGVTCLAVSGCPPRASAWLAVGCQDGTLSVLDEQSHRYVFRRCLSAARAKLTCARFSTCDASGSSPMWLAVGTEDGCIHTLCFKNPLCHAVAHSGPEAVTKVATLRGHAAPLFDVSFADTLPCQYLLSVDTAGQALSFEVPVARRLPSMSVVRDVPFAPWTSPIGWQVLGCWTPEAVREGPGALPMRRFTEAPGKELVAATTLEDNAVDLYPYPCPTAPVLPPTRLLGPSAPVAALSYGAFSGVLLGASDTVLFVWSWQSTIPAHALAPSQPGIAADQDEVRAVQPIAGAGDRSCSPSPLRPRVAQQGGAVVDTPEGRKRIVALAEGAPGGGGQQFSTPQRRTPSRGRSQAAKENSIHWTPAKKTSTPQPSSAQRHHSTPSQTRPGRRPPVPGPAAIARGASVQAPRRAWEALPEAAPPDIPSGQGSPFPEVAPLPGAGQEEGREDLMRVVGPTNLQGALASVAAGDDGVDVEAIHEGLEHSTPGAQPGWQPQHLPRRRAGGDDVGSRTPGGLLQSPGDTLRVHDDNQARARSIHQRQQTDTVGSLLRGGGACQPRAPMAVVAPLGRCREAYSGRFLYRVRDAGDQYEVEAQLPGGRLLRVLRNPLRRTLTFEGEVVSHWALGRDPQGKAEHRQERLVVQVPPGFDLQAPPARVDRHFVEGRCLVAVSRKGFPPAANAPAAGRVFAWDEGEL